MPLITRTKQGAANFGPWENVVRVLILVWFMLYTLTTSLYIGKIHAGQ